MRKLLVLFFLLSFSSFYAQEDLKEKYFLMPWVSQIDEEGEPFVIDEGFNIGVTTKINSRIAKSTTSFLRRLSNRTGVFFDRGFAVETEETKKPSILIQYDRVGELALFVDESYAISVSKKQIQIKAVTDIGVLRALETVLQLVSFSDSNYYISGVNIEDSPRFPWRGLMIDVSRHFEPVNVIKRNLDAMASVKLNVFHWHLSDDQGFRVEVKSRPKLHQLASDGLYYTQNQVLEVIEYANNLGIRVMPEFDLPGHATSWLVAYPEMASKNMKYELERYAGIFDSTLDPTKEVTYKILEDVFTEMASLFPDKYFHIGGDENKGKHWDDNPDIAQYKKEHNYKTNHDLQTYFNIRVLEIFEKNNKIMMGWDEIFQPNLPKEVVIHSWRGSASMIRAAKQGYKTVLSNGYYIDLLKSVTEHYKVDPVGTNSNLTAKETKNILGGEATMWGELVTPLTIDSRIWPRTAAIAERFWSAQDVNNVPNMLKRLQVTSHRLEEVGITHIRNKTVILRSMTHNQNTSVLEDLSNVCEPMKGYTRNKGGTEYKSYSSFMLFADACTADAFEAMIFNSYVDDFIKTQGNTNVANITMYLTKWSKNYTDFSKLKQNPKLTSIKSLSKELSNVTTMLNASIISKKIDTSTIKSIEMSIEILKLPHADVELQVVDSFQNLLDFCKKNYSVKE